MPACGRHRCDVSSGAGLSEGDQTSTVRLPIRGRQPNVGTVHDQSKSPVTFPVAGPKLGKLDHVHGHLGDRTIKTMIGRRGSHRDYRATCLRTGAPQ